MASCRRITPEGRATLSAVMIVKNEENDIAACLDTLGWADEIVVLDSGSTDHTLDLARKRGARVYVQADWKGYGVQRQRAQSYATCDYILAIDADERLTPELRASIERVLENRDDSKVYDCVRHDWFLGKFLNRNWRAQKHVRLYARDKYSYNDNLVHESVDRRGADVQTLDGVLLHYMVRDYRLFLQKLVKYADAWARDQLGHGKRGSLGSALFHASWCFVKMFFLQGGFRDGRYGFLFSATHFQYVFTKHAALWHYARRQQDTRSDRETDVHTRAA